jgi:hypothetical protein
LVRCNSQFEWPPAQQLPQPTIQTGNPVVVYATHSKHYLDGFNDGRQNALFGEEPHDYDQYCEGETNPDSGVEWTKGYDTAFNVTCAFTPGTINDHCNGDNQTFSGYIHSPGDRS